MDTSSARIIIQNFFRAAKNKQRNTGQEKIEMELGDREIEALRVLCGHPEY